jgi:hypothetical protein
VPHYTHGFCTTISQKFLYYLPNSQKLFEMRSSTFNPQLRTLLCLSTNWLAGWLNISVNKREYFKLQICPCREWKPSHPARNPSLYRVKEYCIILHSHRCENLEPKELNTVHITTACVRLSRGSSRTCQDAVEKRNISYHCRESNPDSPAAEPIARRYTDWAIPVYTISCIRLLICNSSTEWFYLA